MCPRSCVNVHVCFGMCLFFHHIELQQHELNGQEGHTQHQKTESSLSTQAAGYYDKKEDERKAKARKTRENRARAISNSLCKKIFLEIQYCVRSWNRGWLTDLQLLSSMIKYFSINFTFLTMKFLLKSIIICLFRFIFLKLFYLLIKALYLIQQFFIHLIIINKSKLNQKLARQLTIELSLPRLSERNARIES